MRFNSLKVRVLAWFSLSVVGILFVFTIFLYHSINSSINLKIKHNLSIIALLIEDEITKTKDISSILKQNRFSPYDIAIYKDKKLMAKKGTTNFQKLLQKTGDVEFTTIENGEFINALYTLKFANNSEKIIIYKKDIDDKIEDIISTMFISESILLLFLILLGNSLIDKILFTLKSITKTANNISISNFSSTIPLPKYDDETKDLVISFNEMIQRIKEGAQKIERFNSDVSHELKTPLTVIRGEIEVATLKKRDTKYYENILKTIDTQAYQIEQIIANLLLLTKYTKENIKQTYKLCYLDSLILQIIEKHDTALKEKSINLDIIKLENIKLSTNEILINSIFSNLIDNAIKYTPNGKNIYISLFTKDDKIHFIIQDEGIGIPQDKIDKITDRFYRVDESRNKSIKGFGLGLSIVKNSIELLEGTLQVESKVGVGTTIEVSI